MKPIGLQTLAAAAAAVATTALTASFAIAAGGPGDDHGRLMSLEHTVHGLQRKVHQIDDQIGQDHLLLNDIHKRIVERLDQHTIALRTPNVVKVVQTKTVPKNGEVTVTAFCPPDQQVISGGYIQGANNGEVTRAIQIQKPRPGYEVSMFEQPGIANGNQNGDVTALAYCAPSSVNEAGAPPKAVVFGKEIPAN